MNNEFNYSYVPLRTSTPSLSVMMIDASPGTLSIPWWTHAFVVPLYQCIQAVSDKHREIISTVFSILNFACRERQRVYCPLDSASLLSLGMFMPSQEVFQWPLKQEQMFRRVSN